MLEMLDGAADFLCCALHAACYRQFRDAGGRTHLNIHHSFLPAFAGADPYGRPTRTA